MVSQDIASAPPGMARTPSHPFDRRWYAHRGGQTQGPYSGHAIRQMVARGELAATDLVHAEGGAAWVRLKDDPILGILFMAPGPAAGRLQTTAGNRTARIPAWAVASVIVAAIAGWTAWPYYTAYGLAVAARSGDVSYLQDHVAWNSVRAGLRTDLNAVLLQKLAADKTAGTDGAALGGEFAAAVGPAIVDRLVDHYVRPEVVASLHRKSHSSSADAAPAALTTPAEPSSDKIADAIKSARKLHWRDIKYAFFDGGPFAFRIAFIPETKPPLHHPISLRFRWDGRWKLTRVLLPMEEIGGLPVQANGQDGKDALAREP